MKYKIGNVEVEAVQWNGDFSQLKKFLCGRYVRYDFTIGDGSHLYLNDEYVVKDSYVVLIGGKVYIFSKQNFNNMATKVKEPKFKVGDSVYKQEDKSRKISFRKSTILQITDDGYLLFSDDEQYVAHESVLFTLEEAIEKLKEL